MRNILERILRIKNKSNPLVIYPDDTFIVSYPKSGNTWMRFIIANYLKTDNTTIGFMNVCYIIPEYGKHNDALMNVQRPRYIKSHNLFTNSFPKVVYIIRDPKDVYVSYYHYLLKKLPERTNFKEFLRKKDLYPSRWHEHIAGWEEHSNILIIKYDELLTDTFSQISRVINFLNLELNNQKLMKAIDESSFDNMKFVEKEKGRLFLSEEEKKKSTTFMRKGITGDWKNYYDEDDLAFIYKECGNIMNKYGYSI